MWWDECLGGEKTYETEVTEVVQEHVSLNFECFLGLVKIKWTHVFDITLKTAQYHISSVQSLSRVLTLCDPMDCSTQGFPVHH